MHINDGVKKKLNKKNIKKPDIICSRNNQAVKKMKKKNKGK
jgi:hypothetical protein